MHTQSYYRGLAYAVIRAVGAWEPGMERSLGSFRWGLGGTLGTISMQYSASRTPGCKHPPPTHNTQTPNSTAWRDFKERWGTTRVSELKATATTAPALLAAAAADGEAAAQVIWTLAALSEASPALRGALAATGLDPAAPKVAALRASGGGAAGDYGWCAAALADAIKRGGSK